MKVDKFTGRLTTADKVVRLVTASYVLFQLDKKFRTVYKKQQRHKPHKSIQTPSSNLERQQMMPPRKEIFLNNYKVLSLSIHPPKRKKKPFKSLRGPYGLA
jgi:hypothetical protein